MKKFESYLIENSIKKIESMDSKIGAFITVNKDYKFKSNLKYSGVPIAIKDNIMVKGLKNTAASNTLKNYIACYDATVIKRLKNAGFYIVGKTNLDEYAVGTSTELSCFKVTKNPHDLTRVSGGSSGGSCAAVASGMVDFALGTETGGSVRTPASFCGVVGLKPTYGLVPRDGAIVYCSSTDQISPVGKNVESVANLLSIISGKSNKDSSSADVKVEDYSNFNEVNNLKIAVLKDLSFVENDVVVKFEESLKYLENFGSISHIDNYVFEYSLPVYWIIATSELSSNLSRLDGVRYGEKVEGSDLDEIYLNYRDKFGDEVKRRIILGKFALSSENFNEYYMKACKARRYIYDEFNKIFSKYDVLITPTTPNLPFKLNSLLNNSFEMSKTDYFVIAASLTGFPAISVPMGKINGLPVGIQFIGKPFSEKMLLNLSKQFENNNFCF